MNKTISIEEHKTSTENVDGVLQNLNAIRNRMVIMNSNQRLLHIIDSISVKLQEIKDGLNVLYYQASHEEPNGNYLDSYKYLNIDVNNILKGTVKHLREASLVVQ